MLFISWQLWRICGKACQWELYLLIIIFTRREHVSCLNLTLSATTDKLPHQQSARLNVRIMRTVHGSRISRQSATCWRNAARQNSKTVISYKCTLTCWFWTLVVEDVSVVQPVRTSQDVLGLLVLLQTQQQQRNQPHSQQQHSQLQHPLQQQQWLTLTVLLLRHKLQI